jgi:hypothetical protein
LLSVNESDQTASDLASADAVPKESVRAANILLLTSEQLEIKMRVVLTVAMGSVNAAVLAALGFDIAGV